MNILKQFDNRLLHREEIIATLESEITPSREEIKKKVSEKLKKPIENIIIETIYGKFGSHNFKIDIKIYDDVESLSKYETVSRKVRKKKLEEEKKTAEEARKAREKAEVEVKSEKENSE